MADSSYLGDSFDNFVNRWGGGSPILIDSDIGWRALKVLEQHCPELIDEALSVGYKSDLNVAQLIDAGLIIERCLYLKGFDDSLKRLKSGEMSAYRELVVAALFNKAETKVELEPPLGSRKVDIGFTFDHTKVFTEIVTPNSSEHRKRLEEAMMALGWTLQKEGRHNAVNVTLLDEPDPKLLGHVISLDKQLDARPNFDTTYIFQKRVKLKYYRPSSPTNVVPARENPESSNLTFSFGDVAKGAHVSVKHKLDEPKRIGRFVDQEIKHFSRDTTNLLIIDTKNDQLSTDDKNQVISARLQPKINRRVSAVLIMSEFYTIIGGVRVQRSWELIPNSYAYNPLSEPTKRFLQDLDNHQLW